MARSFDYRDSDGSKSVHISYKQIGCQTEPSTKLIKYRRNGAFEKDLARDNGPRASLSVHILFISGIAGGIENHFGTAHVSRRTTISGS
jgi:hypothetical protein